MSILVPVILAIALAVSIYGHTGRVWLDDQTQQSDKSNQSEGDSSKDKSEQDKSQKDKSDEKSNPGKKNKSGKSNKGASAPSKAKADAAMERLE